MLTRRTFMIGSALAALMTEARAPRIGRRNIRSSSSRSSRRKTPRAYSTATALRGLSVEGVGTKVTLRVANDYAAVIEGQRAGNIQIAYYGPASFARARMTGVKTDAFAIDVNSDGSKGYYSVFYVLAKCPIRSSKT